jgi:hypothetical protein
LQRRLEETLAARIAELNDKAEGATPEGEKVHGKDRKEQQLEKDHDACAHIAEKKVTLAEQTYNLVRLAFGTHENSVWI